jgi:hypothetical protein
MMESAVIGFLGALAGGVITFCTLVVKKAFEDKDWWRDKGFGVLEMLKDAVIGLIARVEGIEERQRRILDILERREEKDGS